MIKKSRPKTLEGVTRRYHLACGHCYITVCTLHDNEPFEVFATLGKAGGCAKAQLEAITRCISLGLRCGIPVSEFVKELTEIKCPQGAYQENETEKYINSCPDAIADMLSKYPDCEVDNIDYQSAWLKLASYLGERRQKKLLSVMDTILTEKEKRGN